MKGSDTKLKTEMFHTELLCALNECGLVNIIPYRCEVSAIVLHTKYRKVFTCLVQIDEFIGWSVVIYSGDYKEVLSAFKYENDIIIGTTSNEEAVKATIMAFIQLRLDEIYRI